MFVAAALWDLARPRDKTMSKSTTNYWAAGYRATCPILRGYFHPAAFSSGLQLLMRARLNALVLSNRVTAMLGPSVKSFCWLCHNPWATETLDHLLLDCPQWKPERMKFIQHLITMATRLLKSLCEPATNEAVVRLILGGCSAGGSRFSDWFWKKPLSFAAQYNGSEDSIVWRTQPPNVCVAAFLQTVWKQRSRIVKAEEKKLHQMASISPSNPNMRQSPK
jgi:hypothetical protein